MVIILNRPRRIFHLNRFLNMFPNAEFLRLFRFALDLSFNGRKYYIECCR
jgi:hypothetical protein